MLAASRRQRRSRSWRALRRAGRAALDILDSDGDRRLSKGELVNALRLVSLEKTARGKRGLSGAETDAMADEIMMGVDANGDGYITIEDNTVQLKEVLRYVFTEWDTDGDGRISYQEFVTACRLMGMNQAPKVSRQTFKALSGGSDYITEGIVGSADVWMNGMQKAFFKSLKNEGFGRAAYLMKAVKTAWAQSDLSLPARLMNAVQVAWSQSDFLPDIIETACDVVGMAFALIAINNQLNCLPNCHEGVDATTIIPLLVLFRRTFLDSFKRVQDALVRDLEQDKAVVYTAAFKPVGFSVIDFQHMYDQGKAEWRTLPKGAEITKAALDDKLQVICRGSIKFLSQSAVPGLSETSVILGQGTCLGAGAFMDPEDCAQQPIGESISVLEDTLVLMWEGADLRRYFQVNGGAKQQFRVMLARSMESIMWQVSQQTQVMAVELPMLFREFLMEVKENFRADRATLWVYNQQKDVLWTLFVSDEGNTTYVSIDASAGLAGCCFTGGRIVNIPDCYQDDRFNKSVDKQTGYYTKSTLCVPVFDQAVRSDDKPLGVLQLVNKLKPGGLPTDVEEHAPGVALADRFAAFAEADEMLAMQSLWLSSLMVQQLSRRYNAM